MSSQSSIALSRMIENPDAELIASRWLQQINSKLPKSRFLLLTDSIRGSVTMVKVGNVAHVP